LSNEQSTIGIISLDVLGGDSDFASLIQGNAKQIGVDDVMVAATHTHAAPPLVSTYVDGHRSEQFSMLVLDTANGSLKEALQDLKPATVSSSVGQASSNVNRHYLWYSESRPSDSSVKTLQISTESANVYLVRYSAHPTCFDGREMSSDYVGYLEANLRPAGLIFLNGCAGYLNPALPGTSTDATSKGSAAAQQVADDLTRAVINTKRTVVPSTKLSMSQRQVDLSRINIRSTALAESLPTYVSAIRICDSYLVGLPGEPFVETGRSLESAFSMNDIWVVGYADGYLGYLIDSLAEAQGKSNPSYYVAGNSTLTAPEQIGYRVKASDTEYLESAARKVLGTL